MVGRYISVYGGGGGTGRDGLRYVFFTDQAANLNYTFEVIRHTWVVPTAFTSGISALGLTNQEDTGELIVYGLSGSHTQLLVGRKAQGSDFDFSATYWTVWVLIDYKPVTASLSGGVELCAVDAGHWSWFSLSDAAYFSNVLSLAVSSAQDGSATFYPVLDQTQSGPTGFASIVQLPWARPVQIAYAAVMDGSSNVQMVSLSSPLQPSEFYGGEFYPGDFLALTGPNTQLPNGVTAVAAVLQSDSGFSPQPQLYAMVLPASIMARRRLGRGLSDPRPPSWSGFDHAAERSGPSLSELRRPPIHLTGGC